MKKLSKTLKYTALAMLLGVLLLAHFHILDRHELHIVIIVALLVSLAGSITYVVYWTKIAKASEKITGVKKASYIVIFASLFIMISAPVLTMLHQRVIGRSLIVIAIVVFISGFTMLMPTIFIGINKSKNILSAAFYKSSLILNSTLYAFTLCIMIGMLLRIYHYPGSNFLIFTGFSFFVLIFLVVILYLKNKHPASNIKPIPLTSGELDQYIGSYHNQQLKIDITIIKNDTRTVLMAMAPGLQAFPLSAAAGNIFNFYRAGIVMEFKPGENELILQQGDNYFHFIKQ